MRLDGNSILVADADTVYSSQLRDALCRQGASCFHATDINSAKELIGKYNFDVVIANYYLSDGIIHELKGTGPGRLGRDSSRSKRVPERISAGNERSG